MIIIKINRQKLQSLCESFWRYSSFRILPLRIRSSRCGGVERSGVMLVLVLTTTTTLLEPLWSVPVSSFIIAAQVRSTLYVYVQKSQLLLANYIKSASHSLNDHRRCLHLDKSTSSERSVVDNFKWMTKCVIIRATNSIILFPRIMMEEGQNLQEGLYFFEL